MKTTTKLILGSLGAVVTLTVAAVLIKHKQINDSGAEAEQMINEVTNSYLSERDKYLIIRNKARERIQADTKDIQDKIEEVIKTPTKEGLHALELQKWEKALPVHYETLDILNKKLADGEFNDSVVLFMIAKEVSFDVFSIKASDSKNEYQMPQELITKFTELNAQIKSRFITSMKKKKEFRDRYNKTLDINFFGLIDVSKYILTNENELSLIDKMAGHFFDSSLYLSEPMYSYYISRLLEEVMLHGKENSHKTTSNYNLVQCIALYKMLETDWSCPHKDEALRQIETYKRGFLQYFPENQK